MRKFLVIQRINCEPSAVPTSIKASPSQDSEQIQRIQSPSLKQLLGFKVFLRQSQSFFTLQWISANHVKIKLLSIKSTAPYNMKHHQKATLWFCLKKKKKMCGSFGGSKHMWDGLSETTEHAETHKCGALDPVHPQAEARPQVCRCLSPPMCWQTQGHCTSSFPGRTLHSQREKLKW